MNLAKVPIKRIATLIVNGRLQLGEVPSARRTQVATMVEEMRAAQPIEAAPVENMTPEKPIDNMTVSELRALATQFPDIVMESKMRKAELIEILKAAIHKEEVNAS